MRWKQSFISTLRQAPQDAEIKSHRLMAKAGLIQKLSSGLYTFLPMGLKSLRKIESIIRDRMLAHGAEELLMPILQPPDLWLKTKRWESMRDLMLVAKDRQGRDFVFGPTHEEVITDIVSKRVKSYRDLPTNLYQIQVKFRDEIRPRFGLMRAREFIMKDGYSFDTGPEEAKITYWKMYQAYCEIFERCGLKYKIVEADTGLMGGSLSHEFMVLADSGEDEMFYCETCDYAANRELAKKEPLANMNSEEKAIEEVATPERRTVEEVCKFLGVEPKRLIKTMIYQSDQGPFAALCRGDVDINESKVRSIVGSENIRLADDDLIQKITGAKTGYAGPVGLKNIPIYIDNTVLGMNDAVTGANKNDAHYIHVKAGRDFDLQEVKDLSYAMDGDLCVECKKPLTCKRGIEVGHVFSLGTKYSGALDAQYLDEKGQKHPMVMGCYGIGVSRTLAAFIEQNSDEQGILWHPKLAPYEAVIIPVNIEEMSIAKLANDLYEKLLKANIDVILDDRDERAGVKFKDADLIGFPVRITIGKKYQETGCIELKTRNKSQSVLVKVDEVLDQTKKMIELW